VRDNLPVALTFGDFELDMELFELRRRGLAVHMEPQVFDVLALLARNRNRIVSKEELLDVVWGDRFVSESAISSRIKAARRAVGDDGSRQAVIRTVHGRGYRFVAPADETDGRRDRSVPPADGSLGEAETVGPLSRGERGWVERWPLTGRSQELKALSEAFAAARSGGVLLTGEAGVGKSYLAQECLILAQGAGTPTARATGQPDMGTIPLAALSHLLPAEIAEFGSDGELNRAILFHRARSSFEQRATGRRLLLLIDDVNLLDPLSLAVVSALVVARTAFAVLTLRPRPQAGGVPDSVDRLVRDGHLGRIDLGPLDAAGVESLLYRVLGGPLTADTLEQLTTACQGNPGILRHLVESARDRGALVERRGVWRLTGGLQSTPTLESLVDDRIRSLTEREREAMELLAVAGHLGIDLMDRLVGDGVVDSLDEHGLVVVRNAGRRTEVAVAHPLFAEVLIARLPTTRSRRIRKRLTDVVTATGARRRDDLVRIALWDADGRAPAAAPYLVQAARLALVQQELTTAESLARRAHEAAPGLESAQVLSEVHFRRGEFELAESLLARQDLATGNERVRIELARRRATNLFFNLGELEAPLAVIGTALDTVVDPAARRSLDSRRAVILAFGGLVKDALAETDRLQSEASGADRFEILRARMLAQAMAGQAERALPLAAEARALHSALESDLATPGLSVLLFTEATALGEVGRLREARTSIERDFRERAERTTRNWLRIATTRLELTAGYVERAQAAIEPVIHDARGMGLGTIERWTLTLLAMSCLLRGDVDLARQHLEAARDLRVDPAPSVFSYDSDRAFAWSSAAQGAVGRAHEQLLAAAQRAETSGVSAQEAVLLHDVVRLGGAPTVANRLATLASTMEGELIQVRAAHAAAAASGDVVGLRLASEQFESLDCVLMAAEATNQAAGFLREQMDLEAARAAEARVQELAARAGAAVVGAALLPPSRPRTDAGLPLSPRELEIATLAAAGWSNQAIAEQLYLSVRTVGNHLQGVYAKLGINARGQLAAALNLAGG
jgi:DNA-binding winged helix-turn-helix (wHTH) protein/DNA-binding NarL/FixJ family response regulator